MGQYDGREPQTWIERKFEQFRAWMIDSDNRAESQGFLERNQAYLFAGFFVMVWIIIYVSRYGMPLSSWSSDDLAAFIPKRHRPETTPSPTLVKMADKISPAKGTGAGKSPLSRLSQAQASSKSRRPSGKSPRGKSRMRTSTSRPIDRLSGMSPATSKGAERAAQHNDANLLRKTRRRN